MIDLKRYFYVQTIFIDTFNQIDSKISANKILLQMFFVIKHDDFQILNLSECKMFKNCKMLFFDNQIIDAAFMLQKFFDIIPLFSKTTKKIATKVQKLINI